MPDIRTLLAKTVPRRRDAPPTLDITFLMPEIRSLWQKHLRTNVETGACLADNGVGVSLVNHTFGTQTGVSPRCSSEEHAAHLGFIHVHPSADYMIGFSDVDYRSTVLSGDRLSLVYNGEQVFALLRTDEAATAHARLSELERLWANASSEASLVSHLYGQVRSIEPVFSPTQLLCWINDASSALLGFVWYGGVGDGLLIRQGK